MADLANIQSGMGVLGLGASALSGGIFGVVGTALGRLGGFFERKQTFAQERARWAHEIQLQELTARTKAAETEAEHRLIDTQGAWQALSASYEAEARIGESYAWVNAVRALTRPVLTLFLWIAALIIFWNTAHTDGAHAAFVETVTFAATAATLWWFGDRAAGRNR